MTKEELKEAIASTIVENNQKGITATALANLLNEIVDAAGSGGGGGSSAVVVYMMAEGPNEKNAAAYELIKQGFLDGVPCPVVAMDYSMAVFVPLYLEDSESQSIFLYMDLGLTVGQPMYFMFALHQDGSVEVIE